MKQKIMAGALAALLSFGLLACENKLEPITGTIPEEDSGILYFYGVVQQDDRYYVQVSDDYQEEPKAEELLYVPLAAELNACFQDNGAIGAWNPRGFHTAEELYEADQDKLITMGVAFEYGMDDGQMDFLGEHNAYQDFDVTTGKPKE